MPFRKIVDRVMITLDTGQSLGLYVLKRKASKLDAKNKKRKNTKYLLSTSRRKYWTKSAQLTTDVLMLGPNCCCEKS